MTTNDTKAEIKSRIIRIPYAQDNREQWLELRRRGIGGSDAATIVNLNPWSSKLALYADKMGLMPDREDNEAMYWGRAMEDLIATKWEELTGKKTQRVNFILMNEEYPFSLANVDRRIVGERALLECKTTSAFNKTDFESGEIPPYYFVQCQHYLGVTGYDRVYLAVLVGGQRFYHFTIERNDKEIAALMQAEREFWERHIIPKLPPDPDGSESSLAVLDNKVFVDDIELMPDAEDLFNELERVSGMIKEYEDEKDTLKAQIIARLGNRARGQAQSWTVSYMPQERTSVDRKKLIVRYPQAYMDCVTTSSTRTFRVKKMKGEK